MDDDIFSEPQEEKEKKEDSNMDWKKSGIDKHERLTLKVNVKEANAYNAKKDRDTKSKGKHGKPKNIPNGFKKISKKIRDAFDDEDEDEGEYILVPVFMDKEVSSLEKALTPQEKKLLDQMERVEDIHLRQTVERDMKLQKAEETIKKVGLETDRKITEQQRQKTKYVEAKDLAKENIKKRSEKDLLKATEAKPTKPEKELPKIKNAEEKEVSRAINQEAEKEKKSVQNHIVKEQKEKEAVNAVTKEKTEEVKAKAPEQQKKQEQQQTKAQKEEQAQEKEIAEKSARDIILEKSGRISKTETQEQHDSEKQREHEKQNQNSGIDRYIQRGGYSR